MFDKGLDMVKGFLGNKGLDGLKQDILGKAKEGEEGKVESLLDENLGKLTQGNMDMGQLAGFQDKLLPLIKEVNVDEVKEKLTAILSKFGK